MASGRVARLTVCGRKAWRRVSRSMTSGWVNTFWIDARAVGEHFRYLGEDRPVITAVKMLRPQIANAVNRIVVRQECAQDELLSLDRLRNAA